MISIIIAVVGIMFTLGGIGLRSTLKAFGTFLTLAGVIYIGIAITGHYLPLTNHRQLVLAGGVLIVFTLISAAWQLLEKMRHPLKK